MKLNRKTIGILLVVILGCVISIDIYGTYFLTGEEVPCSPRSNGPTSPRLSFHGLFYAVLLVGLVTVIVVGKISIIKGGLVGTIKEKSEKFLK